MGKQEGGTCGQQADSRISFVQSLQLDQTVVASCAGYPNVQQTTFLLCAFAVHVLTMQKRTEHAPQYASQNACFPPFLPPLPAG